MGPSRMIHHLDRLQPAGTEWVPASGFMYFQQFYLGCLSHASYGIGSGGIAAVIDPQHDVGIYISFRASRHNLSEFPTHRRKPLDTSENSSASLSWDRSLIARGFTLGSPTL